MKNDKIVKTMMLAVVALLGLMSVSALQPDVWVSGFRASPAVGRDFNLTVDFINLHPTVCANNIIMDIQAGPPFIMKGISSVPVGDICSGGVLTATVPMSIDPTATGGTYQLTVSTNYETKTLAQYTSTTVLNIFVDGSPDLEALIVSSEPLDVYPGDTATITFDIENKGSFQADSVDAELSVQAPLDVIWSKSKASIGLLGAKQDRTAQFAVEVPKDAASGTYPLMLKVTYLDENLKSKTALMQFGMVVKKKAKFDAINNTSDRLYRNQNSKVVSFSLKNTGTDIAKKVRVRMIPMFPFSTDGTVRYIDELDPGQQADVQFVVNTDKSATQGTYSLDLLVDWEDAQGKSFEDTTPIALVIQKEGIFRKVFIDYWYLWLVAAIIVILVLLRRMRGKKKK
jgi:hypothetical protein